ncbi:MAG: hypothetical protein AMXMBFR47_33470 [Planctomycetota bacterium]
MTQLRAVRKGTITPEMSRVAVRECAWPGFIRAWGVHGAMVSAVVLVIAFACGCERKQEAPTAPRHGSTTTSATAARGSQSFGLYLATETAQPRHREVRVEMPPSTVYMADTPILTGADISTATVELDEDGRSRVVIQFVQEAHEKLAQTTHDHLKKRLAIVVESRVLMAPRIEEEITRGVVILTGDFTAEEFERIAQVISTK